MTVRIARVNGALRWHEDDPHTFSFGLTCPQCAAGVEHITDGKSYAWRLVAAVRCSECRWNGAATVELATVRDTTSRADAGRLTRQDPYEAMAERRRNAKRVVA